MTAADVTARQIDSDARARIDRAADVVLTVSAWASVLIFGALVGLVVFLAVTL